MSDSREKFEAWYAKELPCDVSVLSKLREGDTYKVTSLGALLLISWQAWQHQQSRIDALTAEIKELRGKLGCEYCGGSGDVHSGDGEWRGECHECDANKEQGK